MDVTCKFYHTIILYLYFYIGTYITRLVGTIKGEYFRLLDGKAAEAINGDRHRVI